MSIADEYREKFVNQVTPTLFVLGNTASVMQHVDVEEIYKK